MSKKLKLPSLQEPTAEDIIAKGAKAKVSKKVHMVPDILEDTKTGQSLDRAPAFNDAAKVVIAHLMHNMD